MKKIKKFISFFVIVLLVLPMSLAPNVVKAITPTTIFSDGFEAPTGLGNWVEVGWSSSSSGHSGSKSAYLVGANNDQAISKVISTAGYENIGLSFWFKADSLDNSANNHDKVKFLYTVNGTTWTEITSAQLDYSNDDNHWHNFSFSSFPTTVNNNPNFAIKFDGDLNSDNDKAWIDDVSITGTQIPENTLALCTDNIDNDGDGQSDLLDSDCVNFKPKLTVTKVVVNDNSGTKVVADFPLFVDGNSVTSGTENVYSVGAHTISETSDSNYTETIAGDCASDGSITLTAGDTKSCTITNDDNAPAPVVDVCPNLPDNQTEVPSGYVKEGENCNPIPPPQCTPNEPMTIYSSVGDDVDGSPAVATWVHSSWASIPNATWIWHEAQVSNPTSDETDVFTKTINITGDVTSASIDLATDNGYKIEVNDVVVADNLASEFNYSAVATHNITNLHSGSNTLKITVKNFALEGSTSETNPAGLLYKLTINTQTCPEVPTTATINVKKIVCDSESDLPNWGAGDSTMQEITSNTANRYLSIHPSCHLADWTFEYAPDGTSNPGDNISVAGGAWTPFSGTVSIPASSKVWVREQANPDYIPFSGDTSSEGSWDAVSAEMYCSKDTLNYDNYDYIAPLEAGKTYNCLAFNVLKKAPEPTTTNVKMCKFDDKQNPLSGWTLMLKGEKVQEGLSVPTNISTGINSDSLTAGTSYLALSSGTWTNQGGVNPVDTEYSTTDSWLTHMDGYTGYQTDILELQINNQFDPNSNWGAYNSLHKYAQSFIPSTTGGANFRIFDGSGTVQNEGWFGDNNGNLNVDIYKGYAGITGEDGCVTFTNVPYGSYTADELSQDNWSNTSGLGDVSVNADTNTINVVNHDNTMPAPVCDPQVELIKNGSFENNVVSNPEKWNIFDSGTTGLEWLVEWFGGNTTYNDATRPEVANLELHNGVNGWLPSVGNQYAELDTDWGGPTNPLNGEPASVAISQDVPTIPGKEYKLTFDFSARPGTPYSENILEVLHNGLLDMTAGPEVGTTNTIWTPKTLTFVATTTSTRITFRDAGTPNDSLGTFVDNVSMKCQIPDENPPVEEETDVCSNISGTQTTIPEGKELKDGLCVDIENHEDDTPNPQATSNPGGGNGPVNFGFVAPGGGQVLGASISKDDSGLSCEPYLTTYMRMGKKNNVDEVKKLQTFLNEYLGLNLPITGFFGLATKNAVEQFQIKENTDILVPWVKAGLYDNDKKPTGYVYKTTLRKINLIKCNTLDIPVPQLP